VAGTSTSGKMDYLELVNSLSQNDGVQTVWKWPDNSSQINGQQQLQKTSLTVTNLQILSSSNQLLASVYANKTNFFFAEKKMLRVMLSLDLLFSRAAQIQEFTKLSAQSPAYVTEYTS